MHSTVCAQLVVNIPATPDEHIKNGFPLLKSKIRRLPAVHQVTLKIILEHLARVASNSATNKMDVRNLAIVFGAVIFGEDELPKNGDVLSISTFKVSLDDCPNFQHSLEWSRYSHELSCSGYGDGRPDQPCL